MKVVVLGGGVVGVTTAYYLARDGAEVELVEGADAVGTDATAGNAGLIAPGHSFAWASPRAPAMLARSLLGKQTAIQVRLRPEPQLLRWGVRFLRECTSERARRNTLVKLRLCQYSQRQLDLLARDRVLLHRLRLGALETARAWPDWEQAGQFMAGVLHTIRRQPPPDPNAALARLMADVRAGIEEQREVIVNRNLLNWKVARYERLPGIRHVLALRRRKGVQRLLIAARPVTRPIKRKLLGP